MNKACPVVLRERDGVWEILAFVHPHTGKQIIKGTIEPNESLQETCIRELFEESGIRAHCTRYLGKWDSGHEGQVWGFYLMKSSDTLPDHWQFFTQDGGGLEFSFFWRPLDAPFDDEWHPIFQKAILFIAGARSGEVAE